MYYTLYKFEYLKKNTFVRYSSLRLVALELSDNTLGCIDTPEHKLSVRTFRNNKEVT